MFIHHDFPTSYTPSGVMGACALFPLSVILITAMADTRDLTPLPQELQSPRVHHRRYTVTELASMMYNDPFLHAPIVFVVWWMLGPNYDDALNYFFIGRMHWSSEFLARIQLAANAAKFIGLLMYWRFFMRCGIKELYTKSTWLGVAMYSLPILITTGAYKTLGLNPKFLAVSGELLRDSFGWLLVMPLFIYCVKDFAPPGQEATTLAIATTIPTVAKHMNRWGGDYWHGFLVIGIVKILIL